jgi:hypothetical protein
MNPVLIEIVSLQIDFPNLKITLGLFINVLNIDRLIVKAQK